MAYWFLDGGGGWRYVIPHIKKDDIVIGSNRGINTFFKNILGIKTIDLKTRTSLYSKNPFRILYNIISAKMEYRKYFKDIKNDDLYLFGRVNTITFYSYLNKLSLNNKVYFCITKDPNYNYFKLKNIGGIRYLPLRLLGRCMGLKIGITRTLDKPMWLVLPDTITKYSFFLYDRVEPKIDIFSIIDKSLKEKDTLLLLNDLDTLMYDPEISSNLVASFFDIDRIVLKNHTRNPKIYGILATFDKVPEYIPAEILINNHNWKNIISLYVSKTMLAETDINKICLYYMFKWKFPVSDEWINKYEELNINMPKNEIELRKVIK